MFHGNPSPSFTCCKKQQKNCPFQYPKPPMKFTKILSHLNEHDNNPNLHKISSQIFKKLIDIKFDVNIWFDEFVSNLQLDEKTYLITLQSTIQKLTFFWNINQMIYVKKSF